MFRNKKKNCNKEIRNIDNIRLTFKFYHDLNTIKLRNLNNKRSVLFCL